MRKNMNQEYVISVIIPTYNREKELVATIESILGQIYRNFEIIVVDDGSTDRTGDAVRNITDSLVEEVDSPPRIRYFYQKNAGQSAARNKGIAEARGNWIAFLDSDDVWCPEKLEWQVQAIEQFKGACGACFTDARLWDTQGLDTTAFIHAGRRYDDVISIVPDPVRPLAKKFGGSWIQTIIVRTDLVKKLGGFDPDIHFAEDYDFLFRLSLITNHCCVNKVLVAIDRTNSIIDPSAVPRTWDRIEFRLKALQYMYEKWLTLDSNYPPDVKQLIRENLRCVHSVWTNWYLEQNQFSSAQQSVSTSIGYHITPKLTVKWLLTWIAPKIARKIAPKSALML
jgi:glycosyltransferase involved in cell wall biosynthesis